MKNNKLLLMLSFFLFIPSALANSGACSSHGGVWCNVGADVDGSVICSDGWTESTVLFSDVTECTQSTTDCPVGEFSGVDWDLYNTLEKTPTYVEFQTTIGTMIQKQQTRLDSARAGKDQLMVQLNEAQMGNNTQLVDSLSGQIADAENQINIYWAAVLNLTSKSYQEKASLLKASISCFKIIQEKIATQTSSFNDIDYSIFKDAILYVKTNGIVDGYSDGSYRPTNTINRAEFTKIVINALAISPVGSSCFSDVKDEWFAPYVCTAKAQNILSGYSDGSFKPSADINQAEAFKILVNAFNLLKSSEKVTNWFDIYVNTMKSNNALSNFALNVNDSLLRGEMAQLIYNIKNK